MKTLYIIAYTWRDTDMTIEHFFSSHKTVKRLSEIVDFDEKPNSNDDPEEYLQKYYKWVAEENDNMCNIVIVLETIEI